MSTSTLFSESASRVVVSVAGDRLGSLLALAATHGVPALHIGATGSSRINVLINGRTVVDIAVAEAEAAWDGALDQYFKQRAA
jgi:phosphoribosylformylglycinamidine synthase